MAPALGRTSNHHQGCGDRAQPCHSLLHRWEEGEGKLSDSSEQNKSHQQEFLPKAGKH